MLQNSALTVLFYLSQVTRKEAKFSSWISSNAEFCQLNENNREKTSFFLPY